MSDLISRKEAITAIESHIRTAEEPYQLTEKDEVLNYAFNVAISCLMNLPSAESTTGKWIDRSDGGRILNPWWESCECDQCGEYGSGAWGFCPNCGIRISRGKNDSSAYISITPSEKSEKIYRSNWTGKTYLLQYDDEHDLYFISNKE